MRLYPPRGAATVVERPRLCAFLGHCFAVARPLPPLSFAPVVRCAEKPLWPGSSSSCGQRPFPRCFAPVCLRPVQPGSPGAFFWGWHSPLAQQAGAAPALASRGVFCAPRLARPPLPANPAASQGPPVSCGGRRRQPHPIPGAWGALWLCTAFAASARKSAAPCSFCASPIPPRKRIERPGTALHLWIDPNQPFHAPVSSQPRSFTLDIHYRRDRSIDQAQIPRLAAKNPGAGNAAPGKLSKKTSGRFGGLKQPSKCNPNPATCAADSQACAARFPCAVSRPGAPWGREGNGVNLGKGRRRRTFSTRCPEQAMLLRGDWMALLSTLHHQIDTRSSGARYMPSPSSMPNVVKNSSIF